LRSASLNPLKSVQSAVAAGAASAGTAAGVSAGAVVVSVLGASPPQAATRILVDAAPKAIDFKKFFLFMVCI
jgi:hypothetical protein